MRYLTLTTILSLAVGAAATAQAQYLNTTNFPALGKVHILDPALGQILDPASPVEVIAMGFDWAEGPVWMPDPSSEAGGRILFSDVPQNTIYQWEEGRGLSIFLKPSGFTGPGEYSREPGSNGLALDARGQLLICEHGDRRVSRLTLTPDPEGDGVRWGGKVTVADHFDGRRFNSPNDIAVHSSGAIYFTDPPYGLPGGPDSPARELDTFGVYRVAPDGGVSLIIGDLARPNGIGLSPDESTLYVAQSHRPATITAYPVLEDGTAGPGKVLIDLTGQMGQPGMGGAPDGLAIDSAGNLWATGPGGVWVITPDGTPLGRIETGQNTANCAFGGPDGTTLYITADMYLCRIQTKIKGAHLPAAP